VLPGARWFLGAPFESLKRGNILEFIAYGFHCCRVEELAPEVGPLLHTADKHRACHSALSGLRAAWGACWRAGRAYCYEPVGERAAHSAGSLLARGAAGRRRCASAWTRTCSAWRPHGAWPSRRAARRGCASWRTCGRTSTFCGSRWRCGRRPGRRALPSARPCMLSGAGAGGRAQVGCALLLWGLRSEA